MADKEAGLKDVLDAVDRCYRAILIDRAQRMAAEERARRLDRRREFLVLLAIMIGIVVLLV